MDFYFDKFEDRRPPDPVPYSMWRELLAQFLMTMTLCVGAWYITWRWTSSLNMDALWFAIPLALAETLAYFGSILFMVNLWKTKDYEQQAPPKFISEITRSSGVRDRLLSVDIFFPTYDEEPELVRLSIRDAKQVTYPHPIDIRIHVLDDGSRESMAEVAREEGVNYITRDGNIGFKAGNLRNAMDQTSGDLLVICDADTRPFSTILEHTLGYFRDPDVAWVQTPQWFYDIPEGKRLPEWLGGKLGGVGRFLGSLVERLYGPITIGNDPFVNDPQLFYDVIQRRRNWANASFCCGAGSIHRRDAVMEVALKTYGMSISSELERHAEVIENDDLRDDFADMLTRQAAMDTEITPYKFHVSEDIYTSILLHSDADRNWKSVMHPAVESKMLSPQDLETWMVQRFKYAGGTIDIAVNDNPLAQPGMSLPQRIMYGATIYSYFGALWNIVFLFAPIVFLFTGIAPVSAYNLDFFVHILPFLFLNELATMTTTWGVAGFKGKASYLSFFPVNLKAIWTVLKGEKISFPTTPKERQKGTFFRHVIPQAAVALLSVGGIAYAATGYFLGGHQNLSGLVTNTFWALNNAIAMSGMILAAFWSPDDETEEAQAPAVDERLVAGDAL